MLMSALLLAMVQITAFGYTAPTTPERQFVEDFEDYQILANDYDRSNNSYQNNNPWSGEIQVGQPKDGDYSNTTIYPNGTASVYEGNMADNMVSRVLDAKGNRVTGGTKNLGQDDGWYGYYNGGAQQHYAGNRRISVLGLHSANEINKTQYLSLNPRYTSTATPKTISAIHRNNVALDGYSYLTARVNLSVETSGKSFGHAGIALTKNPNTFNDAGNFDILYFTDSETNNDKLEVYFNGTKVGDVKKSSFSYTSSAVTSSGEWYTIQYRIYNKGTSAMHKLSIVDDGTNEKVVNTEWAPVAIPEGSEFDFNPENKYGIRFYALAETDAFRPRMRLDDISFHNGGYIEDFDSYNISRAANGSNARIGNGAKGNRNITAVYGENGQNVYQGNMAKNVFVHHVLTLNDAGDAPKPNYDSVFGNIPQWQGYIRRIQDYSGNNVEDVRSMKAAATWQHPVAVQSPTARGQAHFGFNTQALSMRANSPLVGGQQTAYAGMENVDFSDKTTISAVFKIQQVADAENDSLKVQLTKGRDKVGAGSKNYEDNSFAATLDVFEMKNNNFYFGGKDIGDYEIHTEGDKNIGTDAFRFEYTVDLTDKAAPKHELKIFNNVTNVLVAHVEEAVLTLPSGFDFANSVCGFRFVNDAPTATGDITTYIDDVKVEKELPASLTGKTSINDAMYSATTNKFTCVADLANAIAEPSVFVFGVYNNDNILQKVYSRNYDTLSANANDIDIDVADDYDSANYYGKLFFWNNFTNITPITESTPVILK